MESSSHNEFSFFKLNFKKSKFNNFRTLFQINTRFLVERFGRTLDLKKRIYPDEEIEVNDMALDIISSIICGPTKILLSDPENIRLLLSKIPEPKFEKPAGKIYDVTKKNFENILDNCDGSFIDKFPNFHYPDAEGPVYQSAWNLPIVSFETDECDDAWQDAFYEYMEKYFEYIQKLYYKENLSDEENSEAYQNFSCIVESIKCGIHDGKFNIQYVATTYGNNKNKDNSIGMYMNQIGADGKISINNDERFLISFEKIYSIKDSDDETNNLSFIQEVFLNTN